MKLNVIAVFLLMIPYVMSSCGTSTPVGVVPTVEPSITVPAQSPSVDDQASLIKALQAAGATAEVADTISQPFFTPEGVFVTINGEDDIQAFEYENAQAMASEASQVAPDGGSVGTSMMMWIDKPHFYKSGHLIVLYIGSNPTILDLLDEVIGSQFAGG